MLDSEELYLPLPRAEQPVDRGKENPVKLRLSAQRSLAAAFALALAVPVAVPEAVPV